MNRPTEPHPFKSEHFLQSLGFACQGLKSVFLSERNFQTHVCMTVLVIIAGFALDVSLTEWAILALCMALMMTVEALNTALEYLVDMLAGHQYSEKAKSVKDIAAGACLLTACGVGAAGLLVFVPHLLEKFLK